MLLQHGAKINLQNSDGVSALVVSANQGHERVVELLLRHGAEINLQDSNGFTALMHAALTGHERVVESLLQCGAEVSQHDGTGVTVLMGAAFIVTTKYETRGRTRCKAVPMQRMRVKASGRSPLVQRKVREPLSLALCPHDGASNVHACGVLAPLACRRACVPTPTAAALVPSPLSPPPAPRYRGCAT